MALDPSAIRDAGPWAVAIFILLSVLVAILRGDLVPGWIHKRTDAERVALRAELDARSAHSDKLAVAIADLAKKLKPRKSGDAD